MDWRKIVGGNIRRLRDGLDVTQEQVAFAADLNVGYFGRIERGIRNPSLLVLVRIATALGVRPAELLSSPKEI